MDGRLGDALAAVGEMLRAAPAVKNKTSARATARVLRAIAAAPDARTVDAVCAVVAPRAREIAATPAGQPRLRLQAELTVAADVACTLARAFAGDVEHDEAAEPEDPDEPEPEAAPAARSDALEHALRTGYAPTFSGVRVHGAAGAHHAGTPAKAMPVGWRS